MLLDCLAASERYALTARVVVKHVFRGTRADSSETQNEEEALYELVRCRRRLRRAGEAYALDALIPGSS